MSTKMISLMSSDGQTFEIKEEAARQCQIINHMIEDDCADREIPLPNVTGKILTMVIEYCKKHHVDADNPSTDEDLKKWDEKFMEKDQLTIFDLINAASYLYIQSLLDLACKTASDMSKDKAVLEDNKWAFE